MPYIVGELDQRIEFKTLQKLKDSVGGFTTSYVSNFECWAKVKVKSGREYNDTDQIQAAANYSFVIRYRSDFDESNIIVWNGKNYNIHSIDDMGGRKLYLVVNAERGVAV